MSRLPVTALVLTSLALSASACTRNARFPPAGAFSDDEHRGQQPIVACGDRYLSFAPCSRPIRMAGDRHDGTPAAEPGERIKLTVSILDQDCAPSAARRRQPSGQPERIMDRCTGRSCDVQKLEDIILTRARDLRRTSIG